MPELPDITAYITALESRVVGQPLEALRISSPLLLRTAVPPIQSIEGKTVRSLRRIGKRIVFVFDDELFLVLHLMIAGRLHWREFDPKKGRAKSRWQAKPRRLRLPCRFTRAYRSRQQATGIFASGSRRASARRA